VDVTHTIIVGSQWLSPQAAESWFRMVAAGCPTDGVTEAGRSYARQQYIYSTWLRELSWPLYRREFKGSAALPGLSKHETGNALDASGRTLSWIRANGASFGWVKDQVSGELWHLEYQSWTDQHITETNQSTEDDDMYTEADRARDIATRMCTQNIEDILAQAGNPDAMREVLKRVDGNIGTIANEARDLRAHLNIPPVAN